MHGFLDFVASCRLSKLHCISIFEIVSLLRLIEKTAKHLLLVLALTVLTITHIILSLLLLLLLTACAATAKKALVDTELSCLELIEPD